MYYRSRTRSGFTLVELLMVALILAILAVVVVPQFSDASTDVKIASLRATLQTVRSQLELYKAQHGGEYPPLATFATCLTEKTNINHVTGQGDSTLGPYLQQAPVNPMNDQSDLTDVGQNGTTGWYYVESTGIFKANDPSVNDVPSKTKDL